jgi:phosphoglucomutase
MDAEISRSIEENLKPWATAWFDWGVTLSSALINLDPYRMVSLSYIGAVCRYTVWKPMLLLSYSANRVAKRSTVSRIGTPSPFIYTPLHGVGATTLACMLHAMGIGEVMLSVSVQFEPDPDFPTVQFPNPEEAGALDLAIRLADKEKRQIIIANDPDADRFAAAEKVK